jgi:hypothetical protein
MAQVEVITSAPGAETRIRRMLRDA